MALFNMESFTINSKCATARLKLFPSEHRVFYFSRAEFGILFSATEFMSERKNNCSLIKQRAAQQKTSR